jgi:hypothetical protein
VKVLALAPHPFYEDRGSPIRLKQVLGVLSERGDQIDLITYHSGKEIRLDNLTIYRSRNVPFINHIRPGFSWKKVICDIFMFFKTISFVVREPYNIVYAVEESAFMALALKCLFKTPYIYAMDSSLAQQMVERYPSLQSISFLFNFFEKLAVRHAIAVIPVCNAVADSIDRYNPKKTVILQDVSLLKEPGRLTDPGIEKLG